MEPSTPPPHDPTAPPSSSQPPRPPKSPPLAFEPAPHDALGPLNVPTFTANYDDDEPLSPSDMGLPVMDLKIVVDQQADALRKIHEGFTAERQSWTLERERLYKRIASLEKLLKTGDHHSPAKSPASPNTTIPDSSASTNQPRLPTIAEDENTPPALAQRRDMNLRAIEIPGLPTIIDEGEPRTRQSSVIFQSGLKPINVEEIPGGSTHHSLSPLPPNNRELAGHTPLFAPPRAATPPPKDLSDDIEDTPTRHNTHLNNLLVQDNDSDQEDVPLKGPLNMPELPNAPGEGNFTLEALFKRLDHVASSPEGSRPTIFAQPSPGMVTPTEPRPEMTPGQFERSASGFIEPAGTRDKTRSSDLASPSLSPMNSLMSPASESIEAKVQSDFESGGIKLKKKASSNFGAPFGSLGGFGGMRKMS